MTNMYTDLERSIWKHLTNGLAAVGMPAVQVLSLQDDLTFPSQKTVIRYTKVYDIPNDDAPRGPGAELLTPVLDVVSKIVSYNRQDWPDGYRVNYKINCCAEDVEVARALETVLRRAFRPKHPVYIYTTVNNPVSGVAELVLTTSYCDIAYKGFLNQDNLDLGFYSRATILQFEVYDYNEAISNIPAIQGVAATLNIGTPINFIPGVDIVITR